MQTTTDDAKGKRGKAAANGAAPPKPKPRTWTEAFMVKLTDEERLAKGDHAAKLDAELEQLEADKKAKLASLKGTIDAKKSEFRDTMRAYRSGQEERPCDVIEEFIFNTNTVLIKRVSDGVVLRERAMTRDERQVDLFDAGKKPGPQATIGEALAAKAARKNGHRHRKPDDGETEITEPGKLLDGAKPEPEGTKRRPAKRRGR